VKIILDVETKKLKRLMSLVASLRLGCSLSAFALVQPSQLAEIRLKK
jgi:hypothetical protein